VHPSHKHQVLFHRWLRVLLGTAVASRFPCRGCYWQGLVYFGSRGQAILSSGLSGLSRPLALRRRTEQVIESQEHLLVPLVVECRVLTVRPTRNGEPTDIGVLKLHGACLLLDRLLLGAHFLAVGPQQFAVRNVVLLPVVHKRRRLLRHLAHQDLLFAGDGR
jgi:hypothetical protein